MTLLTIIDGRAVKPIGPTTVLTPNANCVVVATAKSEPGAHWIRYEGTFAQCDDYAERNNSPDNPDRYDVYEEIRP